MKYKGVDQYRESLVHINRLFIIECLYVIQTSRYYFLFSTNFSLNVKRNLCDYFVPKNLTIKHLWLDALAHYAD